VPPRRAATHVDISQPLLLRSEEVIEQEPDLRGPIFTQTGASMPTTPSAQVLRIAEMVDYQDGSVVSRIVVKAETGSVTLFAFDEGQELSEHTAPFDALVHVLDGEVAIKISGKPFQLKTGEAIVMPANEPHAVKAVRKFKMLLTMIRA
jgi:quercetin dioxygenase-like cupin family protein